MVTPTNRDTATGRYVDTKLEKVCVCGHALAIHTAARVDGCQPCLEYPCPCESFKKARKP